MSDHAIYVPKDGKRKYAQIYEPDIMPHYMPYGAGQERYGISVDPLLVSDPEIIRRMNVKFNKKTGEPLIRLQSKYKPVVTPLNKDVDELVKEIARLEACNLSRDYLFYDRALVIYVDMIDWSHEDRAGTLIVPTNILVQL